MIYTEQLAKTKNGITFGFIKTEVNLSLNEEFLNCEVEQNKIFSTF